MKRRAPYRSRRNRPMSSEARAEIALGAIVWFLAFSVLPAFALFHHWFIPGYRIPGLPF